MTLAAVGQFCASSVIARNCQACVDLVSKAARAGAKVHTGNRAKLLCACRMLMMLMMLFVAFMMADALFT